MRVVELWRYPVKSLLGEPLEHATVTSAGIEGDRAFALFDLDTGFGLTARRVPELLFLGPHLGDAVLDVGKRIGRCVMTTRPQAGGIERDLDVLRTINRDRGGYLAVGAIVVQPGAVRLGNALTSI